MKRTITESQLRNIVAESVKKVLKEGMEYEQLYDKIQEVTNDISLFCGISKMDDQYDQYTTQLMTKMSDLASQLSDIAHELEEHLAWD